MTVTDIFARRTYAEEVYYAAGDPDAARRFAPGTAPRGPADRGADPAGLAVAGSVSPGGVRRVWRTAGSSVSACGRRRATGRGPAVAVSLGVPRETWPTKRECW